MVDASANTTRFDPYKNFKFLVYFGTDTAPVLGVSKVSGLKRTTEVVKHRCGGDASTSYKLPGRTEYDPITLERGVTNDARFIEWVNMVWNYRNKMPNESSLKDFRKDISIVVLDDAGNPVIRYSVYNCWVSEYQPLSDLDANANAVAIEHIKLENEGWVKEEQA